MMVVEIDLESLNRPNVNVYLRTEMREFQKGTCPCCHHTMTKKTHDNDIYTVYRCWNKHCNNNPTFVIMRKYMYNEYKFVTRCECGRLFDRRFEIIDDDLFLTFSCGDKLCTFNKKFTYNLFEERWENDIPEFVEEIDEFKLPQEDIDRMKEARIKRVPHEVPICKLDHMPLLTMSRVEYEHFLSHHQNKVLVLVDVPNFIRTVREYHFKNFDDIVNSTRDLIIHVTQSEFDVIGNYVINYFSNPSTDLTRANDTMRKCCSEYGNEFFHLLEITKFKNHKHAWSDIDSYLTVNAINMITYCDLEGILIVSSDKDYLPIHKLAEMKGVNSRVFGINVPGEYEEHDVSVIPFLGTLSNFMRDA